MNLPVNPALLDRFGRSHNYLRISLTDRCNLRCLYCMPAEGIAWKPREEILTGEEIIRLAGILARQGVDKIRLTGGEPTIREELGKLMQGLSAIPGIRHLLLTTNGITLADNALLYKQCGLSGINISLDSLQAERFAAMTRRPYFDRVMAGLEAALAAGFDSLKINMVVMAGINDDEILDFVRFTQDKPINVRFIEFMPFKGNGWREPRMVSYAEMRERIEPYYTLIPILGEPSAVAKDFAIEGFQGTISFITSMTQSFCGTCNRIRLTAEGAIKSCLFSNTETGLRKLLRGGASDGELLQLIREALWLKQKGHAALDTLPGIDNRSMIQIGG